ncbi:MAG: polysaccharide deacetylase family protein [Bacteroidales bacterium]
MLSKIPGFIQNTPWQNHLWRVPDDNKSVFLTFDDGPTPGITDQVLSILEKYDAKGTFFCLGRNAEHYPELLQKITDQGHRIGNHSYSHLKGFRTSVDKYVEDVAMAHKILKSSLFRPPYGRIRRKEAKQLAKHFTIVMWEILSHDYNPKLSPDNCFTNVVSSVKPGSIIVFHDSLKASKNVLSCLPGVLEHLAKKGYTFKAIPDKY